MDTDIALAAATAAALAIVARPARPDPRPLQELDTLRLRVADLEDDLPEYARHAVMHVLMQITAEDIAALRNKGGQVPVEVSRAAQRRLRDMLESAKRVWEAERAEQARATEGPDPDAKYMAWLDDQ